MGRGKRGEREERGGREGRKRSERRTSRRTECDGNLICTPYGSSIFAKFLYS